MYKLPHFTENNFGAIVSFIQEHPFITLIAAHNDEAVATQIPVLIHANNDEIILRGHFMRNTDHHKAFENNPNALILFTGPQCYISASWYNEREHGSTWNYMTVQATGALEFYTDEQTIELLKDLTHHFEDCREHPELLENMKNDYVHSNVKAIAGFEIKPKNLHATFKLSQNRNDESYKNIVRQLEIICAPQELMIAKEMKKRRPYLFS